MIEYYIISRSVKKAELRTDVNMSYDLITNFLGQLGHPTSNLALLAHFSPISKFTSITYPNNFP
jgi:hypothetical protein